MPGSKPLKFLVLILCLCGTLYSQSTDDEMQLRIRETIRILNEALIRRDRLREIEQENSVRSGVHERQIMLAESAKRLADQRTDFANEKLEFLEREKVPALVSWGLAWRDAYQAAQIPKRKAYCLWLCKRTRKLPPAPVGMEPPT